MKKLKPLYFLGIIGMAILAFTISVFFSQPSTATSINYQKMINLGLVDGIRTPQELGLDYLQREPQQLLSANIMEYIGRSRTQNARLPENLPLKYPIATNAPITTSQMPGQVRRPSNSTSIVGVVNRQTSQPAPITRSINDGMLGIEQARGGNIGLTPGLRSILVADTSGRFLQAQHPITLDIIIYDEDSGKRWIVPDVVANAVCRDMINAFENGTVSVNNTSLDGYIQTLPD